MNTFTDVRPKFVLYPVNSNDLYPVSNTDGDVIRRKGKAFSRTKLYRGHIDLSRFWKPYCQVKGNRVRNNSVCMQENLLLNNFRKTAALIIS